jgi:hypothetical protein
MSYPALGCFSLARISQSPHSSSEERKKTQYGTQSLEPTAPRCIHMENPKRPQRSTGLQASQRLRSKRPPTGSGDRTTPNRNAPAYPYFLHSGRRASSSSCTGRWIGVAATIFHGPGRPGPISSLVHSIRKQSSVSEYRLAIPLGLQHLPAQIWTYDIGRWRRNSRPRRRHGTHWNSVELWESVVLKKNSSTVLLWCKIDRTIGCFRYNRRHRPR